LLRGGHDGLWDIEVKPTSIFVCQFGKTLDLLNKQLDSLRGGLDDDNAQTSCSYLSGGTLIISLMKYTTISLREPSCFRGSGVMSDELINWRRDAVEYVLHLCINIGADEIINMRANDGPS